MAVSSSHGAIVWIFLYIAFPIAEISSVTVTESSENDSQNSPMDTVPVLQTIEGTVEVEGINPIVWAQSTHVIVDGGRFTGYLKSTGEFKVHNMPPGTYLVEVISPNFVFEPIRVDISSKTGKVRARKVNLIKMASVSHLPYPLKFRVKTQAEFFDKREQWSWLDMLKNPMVLFLVAPMLLMFILPKLMSGMDPESTKEMQQSMSALQPGGQGLPSIEEMFTNFFGGSSSSSKKTKSSSAVKKSKH